MDKFEPNHLRRLLLNGLCCGTGVARVAGEATAAEMAQIGPKRIRKSFGVNCFDFSLGQFLKHGVRRPLARLNELSNFGVPFVRFSISPFWPDEWKLYFENKKFFFDVLDEVFSASEAKQIGLIPTIFWNPVSLSDYHNEGLASWVLDGSRTRSVAKSFIGDVVGRYKNSSSLWAWEVANELNTYLDLPNALTWWAKVNPSRGTPSKRDFRDIPTSKFLRELYVWMEREIHSISPSISISSGFDAPRANAFHLSNGSYTKDSSALRDEHFLSLHPAGVDLMSVHAYPETNSKSPLLLRDEGMFDLKAFVRLAHASSRLLFVGEFGVLSTGNLSADQHKFNEVLDMLVDANVDLAALWVYDFTPQNNSWSIQVGGAREYQLRMLSVTNERFL